LPLLVLLGLHAPAANAAPIQFTGNVPNDFNPVTNPGVVVTPVSNNPLNIVQPAWITANGWVSGWSIQDIRKIRGLDPSNGLWIEMYGGSAVDSVGEAGLAWTKVPITAAQNIPEPTTWLAWTLVAGAAACRFRGRIRAQS
jgi:hypothetical protein